MILAIETSCDDSSAAIVSQAGEVISSTVSSQHEIHREFQGIVPELASRRHCELINIILKETVRTAKIDWAELTAVAVTRGPGLIGSLLVGMTAAKAISLRFSLPLIPVNHIEAHAYSAELEHPVNYPYISLVASGGHTMIFLIESADSYQVLGQTRDDAAGEAYDKVARMLKLGYPGGPVIEQAAQQGNPRSIPLPRPTLTGERRWNWRMDNYDFSFSGLKTAVYYHLKNNPRTNPADLAAAFQQAANDCLVYKTITAAEKHNIPRITIGGGVTANRNLQESFGRQCAQRSIELYIPSNRYCTDNAAMIGHRARNLPPVTDYRMNAEANLKLTPSS